MKIGLLLCDHVHSELQNEHQDYPYMFWRLFKSVDPDIEMETFAVVDSVFPDNLSGFDAWLVSGSRHSVLDNLPWIQKLSNLVLTLIEQQQKIIGVCFGHQLIAQVMGGKVETSYKGWGIGVSNNHIMKHKTWLKPDIDTFNVIVSHKEQVIKRPEQAELIAGNDFCENHLLQYDNQILSFQGHPEFSKAYIKALMASRKKQYPPATYTKAKKSLELTCNDKLIARWIIQFILQE